MKTPCRESHGHADLGLFHAAGDFEIEELGLPVGETVAGEGTQAAAGNQVEGGMKDDFVADDEAGNTNPAEQLHFKPEGDVLLGARVRQGR